MADTTLLKDNSGNMIDPTTGKVVMGNQAGTGASTLGGAFSGLASLIGGQLLGPSTVDPNYQSAINNLQGAQNTLAMTPIPTTQQMQLVVKNYVNQGILTPTQAQAIIQNPSALNSIMTNPSLINAQYGALSQLQQLSQNGGISPQMQAQLNAIQQNNAAQARGANQAVIQQAQMRGMGNAGTTLLAQLTNNQNEASNNYNQGINVVSLGQQNALNALTQGAGLANTMQQNSFNQQAQQAQAQNTINQFNAANAQNVNLTNTGAQNQAAAANLANAQNTSNLSTGAQNQAAAYNAQLPQQQFADTLAKNKVGVDAAKNTADAQQDLGQAQTTASGNATNSLSTLFGNPNSSGSIAGTVGKGAMDIFGNLFS